MTALISVLALLGPVLIHSSGDPSPVTSAGAFQGTVPGVGEPGGPVVYERTAGSWRQWWILFAENLQDRGIVRTGRHAGDWELVQVRFAGARPVEAVFAPALGRGAVPLVGGRDAGRPV